MIIEILTILVCIAAYIWGPYLLRKIVDRCFDNYYENSRLIAELENESVKTCFEE